MSDTSANPPRPAGSGFPRKVILLVLVEIDSAVGYFMLIRNSTALPILGANLLAIMLLGMAAGFAVRMLMYRRNWFIRFVSGTAALIIGLYLLGFLTHWLVGVGPFAFGRKTVDWINIGKLSLGVISFLLSMQAWWKPAQQQRQPQISPVPVMASFTPSPVPARTPVAPAPKVRAKRKPSKQSSFPSFPFRGKTATAKRASKASGASQKISRPATKSRRSLFRQKPEVHLSKIERHICPYCLEPVTRNDSRGVVECDICHTLHHGDCWAIAGSCQVPHYTAA